MKVPNGTVSHSLVLVGEWPCARALSRWKWMTMALMAMVFSSSVTLITGVEYPEYSTGDCSGLEEVMTVNLGYYQSWAIYRTEECNPTPPEDLDVQGNGYTHYR